MRIAGLGIALVLVGCGKVQPLQVDAAAGGDAAQPDGPGPARDAAADAAPDALMPVDGFVNGSFEHEYAGWALAEDSAMPMFGYWGIAANNTTFASGTQVHDYNDNVDGAPSCFSVGTNTVVASDGDSAAFNAQSGPEDHRMWQDVTVPVGAQMLTWSMSWSNSSPFDLTAQFIAIEVRDPASDAIVATLYTTDPAATPPPQASQAMSQFAVPISAYAGQTVRITVDLQAQQNCLFAVFDNFRITP